MNFQFNFSNYIIGKKMNESDVYALVEERINDLDYDMTNQIEKLEEQIQLAYELPPMHMIG